MKNPFKRKKSDRNEQKYIIETNTEITVPEETGIAKEQEKHPEQPEKFIEWGRSNLRGGIERRERNDIFEAYNVYGTDGEGHLVCRRYHRYPEHERNFGLSYSRALSFDEFNRRLLGELDRCDMSLGDYNACIRAAESLAGAFVSESGGEYTGFSEREEDVLAAFCEGLDTLKDKSYLHRNGVFRCDCESLYDPVKLNLWFRRPIRHDAMLAEISGVKKETIGGYDIENLWVMSVYNRIYERSGACKVMRLTSEWSIGHEKVYLVVCEDFEGIGGTLVTAVGEADDFLHFGFYALDFASK